MIDDPAFQTPGDRYGTRDQLNCAITEWNTRPTKEEPMTTILGTGISCSTILDIPD